MESIPACNLVREAELPLDLLASQTHSRQLSTREYLFKNNSTESSQGKHKRVKSLGKAISLDIQKRNPNTE
jgi:hypothetical protein